MPSESLHNNRIVTDEYLYPPIEPYASGMLKVGAPHRLYFEQCGNPDSTPAVFLHGGPGSGCAPAQRQFFDPARYRIILFDQRGAGRSEPAGCLNNNKTPALVDDLERLRVHLNVEQWLLYGGSWGATLALLYARRYPQRVSGLVLRGVFLARKRDVVWVYGQEGVGRLFPCEYQCFLDALTAPERADPVAAYYQRFNEDEPASRERAAARWHAWESRVVRQFLPPKPQTKQSSPAELLRRALIVSHYARHDFFIGPGGVPLQFDALQDKPCIIIHGQRDMVCPLESAWTLHRAWPHSELKIVEEGGHVAAEPAIGSALAQAFDQMITRL